MSSQSFVQSLTSNSTSSGNRRQFLSFSLADQAFAVPIEEVREITGIQRFTPVPDVCELSLAGWRTSHIGAGLPACPDFPVLTYTLLSAHTYSVPSALNAEPADCGPARTAAGSIT